MAAAIPWAMMAGAAKQGIDQSNALSANAATYGNEAKIASAQGYEAEAQQRRNGAQVIGRETAAAGQANAGYGGSTGRSIAQSANNAELDALNIRYKSQLQKWGYASQAANLNQESRIAQTGGVLNAGGALLKGYANYRTPDLG